MGAYLEKPRTETVSDEGKSRNLSFGVSTMQGWRITQEDAHVCKLNFDDSLEETSVFAVFDGHGGAEVAEYAAKHLPLWIKNTESYKNNDLDSALRESFLGLDKSLVQPHVLQILKEMAGDSDESDEDEQLNEAIMLKEEADMPIDQLVAKYGCEVLHKKENSKLQVDGDAPGSSSASAVKEAKIDEPKPTNGNSDGNGTTKVEYEELDEKEGEIKETEPQVKEVEKVIEELKEANEVKEEVKEETNGNSENIAPKLDKGKGKKIIPKREELEPVERNERSLYQRIIENDDEGDSEEVTSDSSSEDDDEEEDDDEDECEADEDEDEEQDGPGLLGFGDVPGKDSGCTACVAVIRGNQLYVANAGDSRCVVCRDGVAVEMSIDHKPEDEVERNRIEKAGGQVTADGRVNGGLNLSRALGDHSYKDNSGLPLKEQMISPEPDVKKLELSDKDEFLVVACDGIWNSMTSQEVVNFVRERIEKQSLVTICENLFQFCLAPDSSGDGTGCDNMTAIVVSLKNTNLKRKTDDEEDEAEPSKKSKDQTSSSSSSN